MFFNLSADQLLLFKEKCFLGFAEIKNEKCGWGAGEKEVFCAKKLFGKRMGEKYKKWKKKEKMKQKRRKKVVGVLRREKT